MGPRVLFDPASVWAGLVIGAVSGFLLAGIAATLIRLAARLLAGPTGARPRPVRLLLISGIVSSNLAALWALEEPVVFAIAWAVAASTTGAIHLIALGLAHRRKSRGRARFAYWTAWVGCGFLALFLVGLAADGAGIISFAIVAVLVIDVAIQRKRVDRESRTESIMEGGGTPRSPAIQFTLRRIMAAVVVAALPFGGAALWRRSGEYRELADRYTREMEMVVTATGVPPDEAKRINNARDAYLRAMVHKYDRAARYPFLPVAPGPTEPE